MPVASDPGAGGDHRLLLEVGVRIGGIGLCAWVNAQIQRASLGRENCANDHCDEKYLDKGLKKESDD
jgi:hypothetical protein